MNLLLISASYPPASGGVATHVANLAQGLLQWNKEGVIHVLTRSTKEKRYENKALKVWKLDTDKMPMFSGRHAPYEEIIKVVFENWGHDINADIIHAHDLESTYIGWMLKIAFKKPLIVTVHRAPVKWKKYKHTENPKDCFMEAIKLYQLADLLIVPSKASADVLIEQGYQSQKIEVIPHGIGFKYLSSLENKKDLLKTVVPNSAILILCPGRSEGHKDPDTFVRAAAILKQRRSEELFFIFTDEPAELYKSDVLAESLGLIIGKDIVFKRYDYKEMPTLYRRARVCVIPSARESFGQAVLESFVFRTPVVAANTTALSEIINHKENGLLFDAGSEKDLADRIEEILNDKVQVNRFIKKAEEDVIMKYNVKRMTEDYFSVYNKIINGAYSSYV